MAVWGIGAYYKNSSPLDRTKEFIRDGCAYIGWEESDASALYRMFDSIKAGDLIYINPLLREQSNCILKLSVL